MDHAPRRPSRDMDLAPRRPSRPDRKHVYFNPEVQVRIVKSLLRKAKRSDLWVSGEDMRQTREEFHDILDCLTLDSSFYEEGGYFLMGLDSKKDQKQKYRNMLESRYAVLKEQRKHNANSRWHSGVGSNNIEDCISSAYQEHTIEAANTARYTAVRLEEEVHAEEVEKPEAQIMSLRDIQTLLKRTTSTPNRSSSMTAGSFHDVMDIWVKDVHSNHGSNSDEWSIDSDTDEEDEFGYETVEVSIPEDIVSLASRGKQRSQLHEQERVGETRSTAQSDWSAEDISTDNDDDFLGTETSELDASVGSLSKQSASLQGSVISVPAMILPTQPILPNNAIAA